MNKEPQKYENVYREYMKDLFAEGLGDTNENENYRFVEKIHRSCIFFAIKLSHSSLTKSKKNITSPFTCEFPGMNDRKVFGEILYYSHIDRNVQVKL